MQQRTSATAATLPQADELRELMARALTSPTPVSVMHFARFASRMKAYGPYNVYMIYAQRPGAGAVGSKAYWTEKGRSVRPGAIPMIILKPLGPITQVYEELDTTPQEARQPEQMRLPQSDTSTLSGSRVSWKD
jgi:hypothetical protein